MWPAEWKISPDGLTYTFKIRPGVRFHDGSPLTAADVKASYDKIVFPPEGVRSIRKDALHRGGQRRGARAEHRGVQAQVPLGLAPDEPGLAMERHLPEEVPRQGPELLQEQRRRAPGPSSSRATRAARRSRGSAIPTTSSRTGRTSTGTSSSSAPRPPCGRRPFARGAPTSSSATCPRPRWTAIKKQLGDKVVVQETPSPSSFGIAINNTVKPFTDVRVRKALTLGIDRYTASKVLYPLTGLRDVGALMRPGTEWAMPEAELQKFPGFGKDIEKNRAEARRLLAEAGYPNGFKVVLKNRNVKLPYQDLAVFLVQEWRKIGIEAEHRPLETAAWFADGRDTGQLRADGLPRLVEFIDDPDQLLAAYPPGSHAELGPLLRPPDRRPVRAAGAGARSRRAPEAGHPAARGSCWKTPTTCRGSGGRATSCTGPR